jgi:hypothetical protein
MFRSWKRRAIDHIDRVPDNEIDWLAIAQHHGLATRLLDWTINPLVAAYFEVCERKAEDAVVYAHYTCHFWPSEKLRDREMRGVCRIRPSGVVARLLRQGGGFTLPSPPTLRLDENLAEGDKLEMILIAQEYRAKLRLELSYYGFNHMTLFPDLDGLSQFVNWWTENRREYSDDELFPGEKQP